MTPAIICFLPFFSNTTTTLSSVSGRISYTENVPTALHGPHVFLSEFSYASRKLAGMRSKDGITGGNPSVRGIVKKGFVCRRKTSHAYRNNLRHVYWISWRTLVEKETYKWFWIADTFWHVAGFPRRRRISRNDRFANFENGFLFEVGFPWITATDAAVPHLRDHRGEAY